MAGLVPAVYGLVGSITCNAGLHDTVSPPNASASCCAILASNMVRVVPT